MYKTQGDSIDETCPETNRLIGYILEIDTDTSATHSKHGRQSNKVVFWFWKSIENAHIHTQNRNDGFSRMRDSYPSVLWPPSISKKALFGRVSFFGTLIHK
jgi:hypothetical protein